MTIDAARPGVVKSDPDRAEAVAPHRPRPWAAHQVRAWQLKAGYHGAVIVALVALLLLNLSALLVFGTSGPTQPAQPAESAEPVEIDLRVGPSSSNLNSTSAETSIRLLEPPSQPGSEPPRANDRAIQPPEVPLPPPVIEPPVLAPPVAPSPAVVPPPPVEPPPVELPRQVVQAAVVEIPELPSDPHQGDSPMKRTWTRVGLPTLLVAALAASPTFAHDGEPDKTDAILLQLKNLTKSVQELKGMPSNLTDLNKKIGEVEKRLADQLASQEVNATVRMQALQRELNTLKDQHAQMKLELEALRTRPLTKQPTVSLYPPGNGSTTTGRLRLVNTFPEQISIAVNNRPAYRVEPNEVVWVEGMPSGQFTYEVLGIQSKLSRSLTAGETFTIHVYPR